MEGRMDRIMRGNKKEKNQLKKKQQSWSDSWYMTITQAKIVSEFRNGRNDGQNDERQEGRDKNQLKKAEILVRQLVYEYYTRRVSLVSGGVHTCHQPSDQ